MLSLLLGLISLVRRTQGTQVDVSEEARDGQRHEHGVPSDPMVDSGEVEAETEVEEEEWWDAREEFEDSAPDQDTSTNMEPNRDSSLMWMKSQRNQKWPKAVRDCIRQVRRKLHTSNRRHRDSSNVQDRCCKDQTISRPSITANYLHRSPSSKQIHLPEGHNTDQEDSSSSCDEIYVHNQKLERTPKSVHWGSVSVLHLPHRRPAWREVYKLAPILPSVQEYKPEDALTNTLGYRNHLPLEIRV